MLQTPMRWDRRDTSILRSSGTLHHTKDFARPWPQSSLSQTDIRKSSLGGPDHLNDSTKNRNSVGEAGSKRRARPLWWTVYPRVPCGGGARLGRGSRSGAFSSSDPPQRTFTRTVTFLEGVVVATPLPSLLFAPLLLVSREWR